MAKATCPRCNKTFRNARSIVLYHGWCARKMIEADPSPIVPQPEPKKPRQSRALSAVLKRAEEAAEAAWQRCVPEPMVVVERADPLDDASPIVRRYEPVMDGLCGFGWVRIAGNTSLARTAKARYGEAGEHRHPVAYVSKGYPTGLHITPAHRSQSYERKRAWAGAFASVLRDAGFEAYADGRLD